MKTEKDRYKMYKQALYAATHDTDFMMKHPDFALCHARVFYDDLKHEGYKWYPESGVWSKTAPKKEQPKKRSKSPSQGIPAAELFKVRIIAPESTINALASSTVTLYSMADCVLVAQGKVRQSHYGDNLKMVFFTFRLPG